MAGGQLTWDGVAGGAVACSVRVRLAIAGRGPGSGQAAVLARIMQLTQSPERMLADFRCEAPPHEVRVQCLVPQNAAVLHAGTGMGKTFVAA